MTGLFLSRLGSVVAFIGICVLIAFTTPFVGGAYTMEPGDVKRKTLRAWIGNIFLLVGTAIQVISLFVKG